MLKADLISPNWIAFPEYPFTLGLKYPFPGIISESFRVTSLSFIQAMPIIWCVLYWINHLNQSKKLNIGVGELASVYDLSTYGSSRFLFKVKTGQSHLVLRSKQNDGPWKEKFFFVKRASIPDGNLWPQEWVLKGRVLISFMLFDSDSYISFSCAMQLLNLRNWLLYLQILRQRFKACLLCLISTRGPSSLFRRLPLIPKCLQVCFYP